MQGGPVLSGAVPASGHRPGGGGGPGHFAAGRDHRQSGQRHGADGPHRPGAGGGAPDGGLHLPPALPSDRRAADRHITRLQQALHVKTPQITGNPVPLLLANGETLW